MSESGFASLGPSLLARKGGAKPAMRPQVAPLATAETPVAEDQLEDLGWNDMGHDHGEQDAGAEIVPINGALAPDLASHIAAEGGPIVRRQQRRLEERVLADAAMTGRETSETEYDEEAEEEGLYDAGYAGEFDEDDSEDEGSAVYAPLAAPAPAPAPIAAPVTARKPARVPAAEAGRRAAFTLRLDADRHLKLRLAATMQGVSAQVLVTEALDRLLAEYDDLDIIANHLKRH